MPENSMGTTQQDTKKSGNNKTIIIIGIAVIVLLLIVIVLLLLRKPAESPVSEAPAEPTTQTPQREVLVNEDNIQDVVDQNIDHSDDQINREHRVVV